MPPLVLFIISMVGATLLSDVVSTSLNQRRIDLRFQHFYNVVSTSGADVVSTSFCPLGKGLNLVSENIKMSVDE